MSRKTSLPTIFLQIAFKNAFEKDEHIEIVLMAGSGSCHQVALELGYQTVAIVGRDKSVCAFTKKQQSNKGCFVNKFTFCFKKRSKETFGTPCTHGPVLFIQRNKTKKSIIKFL